MSTEQGKDFSGSSFAPYAASTKKHRAKRQRSTGKVNLNDTGIMMQSLGFEVTML
jgi:hypothetical protein